MSDNQDMPAPINFTDSAAKKVAELIGVSRQAVTKWESKPETARFRTGRRMLRIPVRFYFR